MCSSHARARCPEIFNIFLSTVSACPYVHQLKVAHFFRFALNVISPYSNVIGPTMPKWSSHTHSAVAYLRDSQAFLMK